MKLTFTLVAALVFLSFNTGRAQEAAGESNDPACLNMVIDEINKDLKFLVENPEGNDSAIYHLTRLRNRILAKMNGAEERTGRYGQDSIIRMNHNSAIQDRIDELQKERERLLQSSSETNPVIKNLDSQIEKLEQSKKEN